MPDRSSLVEKFKRKIIPVEGLRRHVEDRPFVVAFDTGNGYRSGTRISLDGFYDIIEEYDRVIVHWKEGDHPSQKEHYLLYRDAKDIDLRGDDIEDVISRKRSKEVVGDFRWFYHGKGSTDRLSIGLHCIEDGVWDELP